MSDLKAMAIGAASTLTDGHVHDCTGPDMTCPCGFKFTVPRLCVTIEVQDGPKVLISEGFNCDLIETAIHALREAALKLEQGR